MVCLGLDEVQDFATPTLPERDFCNEEEPDRPFRSKRETAWRTSG